jgi:hypothetical protein
VHTFDFSADDMAGPASPCAVSVCCDHRKGSESKALQSQPRATSHSPGPTGLRKRALTAPLEVVSLARSRARRSLISAYYNQRIAPHMTQQRGGGRANTKAHARPRPWPGTRTFACSMSFAARSRRRASLASALLLLAFAWALRSC